MRTEESPIFRGIARRNSKTEEIIRQMLGEGANRRVTMAATGVSTAKVRRMRRELGYPHEQRGLHHKDDTKQ